MRAECRICMTMLILGCGQDPPKSTPLPTPELSALTVILAAGDGLEPRSLIVSDGFLLLEGCAMGTGASLFLGEDTELSGLETTLLGGNWCGLNLNLGQDSELKAITHRGDWLAVPLTGTEIALQWQEGFSVDGQSFILELGSPGWLNSSALGMDGTADITLASDDPNTAMIIASLQTSTTLFEDLDGNGVLSTSEREAVRAYAVTETEEDTGSPDTGQPADEDTGMQDTAAD